MDEEVDSKEVFILVFDTAGSLTGRRVEVFVSSGVVCVVVVELEVSGLGTLLIDPSVDIGGPARTRKMS